MLLLSAPVGMLFGLVTWAALRGRGGLAGLVLLALFGTLAGFAGGLGGNALAASASDGVITLGTLVGAALVTVVGAVGFGSQTRPPAQLRADESIAHDPAG
jgi:hypothetical protein